MTQWWIPVIAVALQIVLIVGADRAVPILRVVLLCVATGGAAILAFDGRGHDAVLLFAGTCVGYGAAHYIAKRAATGRRAPRLGELVATVFIGLFLLLAAVILSELVVSGFGVGGFLGAVLVTIICGTVGALFAGMLAVTKGRE
jgi:hypothetical protein